MPVMLSACFCPPRRLAGRALLWPLLLLLSLLVVPHGTAAPTVTGGDELLASPLETVVAVGREQGHWRAGRGAEKLRFPGLAARADDAGGDMEQPLSNRLSSHRADPAEVVSDLPAWRLPGAPCHCLAHARAPPVFLSHRAV